jgi:hypothetical protein
VSEFTSGVTPGFSPGAGPSGITSGPDGRVWFAEYNRGGVGAITVGPGVTTDGAGGLGASTVTLEGSVRPNGQQTVYRFEYGLTTAYGLQTSLTPAGSGVPAVLVSAVVAGLQPGTVYHYRLVATNDTDTTIGQDQTFTTGPGPSGGGSAPRHTATERARRAARALPPGEPAALLAGSQRQRRRGALPALPGRPSPRDHRGRIDSSGPARLPHAAPGHLRAPGVRHRRKRQPRFARADRHARASREGSPGREVPHRQCADG